MKRYLILEDGTVFSGFGFGAPTISTGFNQLLYELCLVNIIKFIPSDFFKTINSYRQF